MPFWWKMTNKSFCFFVTFTYLPKQMRRDFVNDDDHISNEFSTIFTWRKNKISNKMPNTSHLGVKSNYFSENNKKKNTKTTECQSILFDFSFPFIPYNNEHKTKHILMALYCTWMLLAHSVFDYSLLCNFTCMPCNWSKSNTNEQLHDEWKKKCFFVLFSFYWLSRNDCYWDVVLTLHLSDFAFCPWN